MSTKLKYIILAGFIAFILFILAVIVLMSNTSPAPTPTPTPIPTIVLSPTPQSLISPITLDPQTKAALVELLPITTTEYDIEYLASSDSFVVTIKESPYAANRQKAEQWFRDQGITEISSLPILWNQYDWVE